MEKRNRQRVVMFFVLLLALTGLILSLRRSDILWAVFSITSVSLMFALSKTDIEDQVRWDMIKLIFVPLLLGSAGILRVISLGAILPAFGFMLLIILDKHTDVRVNISFSTAFIILFSLAIGAIIGMARFVSDLFLGTSFLIDNYDLMIDMFVTTFFAFLESIFVRDYLFRTDFDSLDNLKSPFKTNSKDLKKVFVETLRVGFKEQGRDVKLQISKILQLGIISITIYGLITLDIWISVFTLIIFGLTMIPYIYTWNLQGEIPSVFHFWISLTLFLYVVGETAGCYSVFGLTYFWWNNITHFIGGTAVAILTYILLVYLNRISDSLYLPPWLIPILVVTFMISIGVIWELLEFGLDMILNTNIQASLYDTITDIAFDMFGTSIGMPIAYIFYSEDSNS